MKSIDDNLLAAYLEGNLDEEDTQAVEEIIESDPELLEFVEEWVAINDTMCASLPWKEEQSPATGEIIMEIIPKPRPVWRPYLIAASLLAVISIPAVLLFRGSHDAPGYGTSKAPYYGSPQMNRNSSDLDTVKFKDTITIISQ